MRIAVIGDMHVAAERVAWHRLLGPRALAVANARFNPNRFFDRRLLTPVAARVAELEPDLLVLTGDLTTSALPEEFDAALEPFRPLLGRVPALAIPGNHDRYTFRAARQSRFERAVGAAAPDAYPAERRVAAGWRLVALDAAGPRVCTSRGRIGARQRAALVRRLPERSEEGLLVVCHYPPAVPPGRRWPCHHRLADRRGLLDDLGRSPGPVIVLHGHVHSPWDFRVGEAERPVRLVNAGSPTQVDADHPAGQGFAILELPERGAPVVRRETPRGAPPFDRLEWAPEPGG